MQMEIRRSPLQAVNDISDDPALLADFRRAGNQDDLHETAMAVAEVQRRLAIHLKNLDEELGLEVR